MKFLSFVLIASFISSTSLAEPKAYFDLGWFKRNIVVDGKSYTQSFFGGFNDLPAAMNSNPVARQYAETASNQWMWTNIISTATLVGLVYYVSQPVSRFNADGWTALLASVLATSILQFNAILNENRAVNAYNGVTKITERSLIPDSFAVVPVAGGGAGVLGWSF